MVYSTIGSPGAVCNSSVELFQKQSHGLDMVGLGEHIDRLYVPDAETSLAKSRKITAQRGRITGYINQSFGGYRRQLLGQTGSPLAGGINDHTIENLAFFRQFPACAVDRTFYEPGIAASGRCRIVPGAADGRTLPLDTQNRFCQKSKGDGKIAHAAVEIQHRPAAVDPAKFDNGLDEGPILAQVYLTEAARLPKEVNCMF